MTERFCTRLREGENFNMNMTNQGQKVANAVRQQKQGGILDELEEFGRSAGEQVAGSQEVAPSSGMESQVADATPTVEESKKHRLMEAYQRELQEIDQMQKRRLEEDRVRKEEIRNPVDSEQRLENSDQLPITRDQKENVGVKPLPEPSTRRRQGPDLFGIGKKQKSVEMPKAPTQ